MITLSLILSPCVVAACLLVADALDRKSRRRFDMWMNETRIQKPHQGCF